MRRRLVHLVALASLALFIATATLWVRDHTGRRAGEAWVRDGRGSVAFGTLRGYALFERRWRTTSPRAAVLGTTAPTAPPFVRASAERDAPVTSPVRWRHDGAAPSEWTVMPPSFSFGGTEFMTWWDPVPAPKVTTIERGQFWVVPMWCLLIAFSLLPAAWFGRWVASRRKVAPGVCPSCGYDLRATPDRCPECGAIVAVGNP